MKEQIKEYWNNLKLENTHTNAKEKFKLYLEELLKENPKNVDAICALAMVIRESKYGNEATPLLEDFIKKYEAELSQKDRARIYTNLAFYYENCEEEIQYLQKAEELNSPFMETYEGLGLYYFTKFADMISTGYGEKSLNAFKKALEIDDNYKVMLGYAVCLFELKEYEKAKEFFEEMLIQYPNRMRLLLCMAYCEVYLGNKENAQYYLKQIKVGRDENYDLSTDDIADFQIYDAYYVLEEYELFLEECEKIMVEYFFYDGDYYYYSLWKLCQKEKFEEKIEIQKRGIVKAIKNAENDEDFEDKEEKKEYIQSCKEDLENLIAIENKIKNENYKPVVNLHLEPEYGCYLIDCMRHKF